MFDHFSALFGGMGAVYLVASVIRTILLALRHTKITAIFNSGDKVVFNSSSAAPDQIVALHVAAVKNGVQRGVDGKPPP